MAKATGFRSARAAANTPTKAVTVKYSRAYLQKIMDETIGFSPAAKVQLTEADPVNDRAVLLSMCGQTQQRGDIALIRISPGLLSSPNMYRGGFGSTSWAIVKEMWYRSPQPGDQYCTGGATTGELCGWVTQQVGVNYTYADGEGARNIVIGTKTAPCLGSGDSGGPVYTVRSDGGIAAKGIISGGGVASQCRNEYTDIYQALYGFVGWLATG